MLCALDRPSHSVWRNSRRRRSGPCVVSLAVRSRLVESGLRQSGGIGRESRLSLLFAGEGGQFATGEQPAVGVAAARKAAGP